MATKIKINTIITILKNKFSSNEIIHSVLKIWCETNNIDPNLLKNLSECSKYNSNNNADLSNLIKKDLTLHTLKDLEAIFESLIDSDRKKAEGAVYTPDYIIDYIINYSLSIYKATDIPIICDPACGSGGFLIRSIIIFSKKYAISIEDTLKYIRGVDVNMESVSCAKMVLEVYFLKEGIAISSLDNNIICADTLLTPKDTLLLNLNAINGIDILATNPPYVKLQNIPSHSRGLLIDKYPNFTKGSYSFAMLFLIAGQNLLSEDGVLGYITQNNFFTSLAAKNIREYLQETKSIHTIVDFLHSKVFENASAYTCLIFLSKEKLDEFNFTWALNPIKSLGNTVFSKIKLNGLNSKKWRLAPSPHLENIYKIETIHKQLGEISDIRVGFATLKDTVFLLNNNSNIDIEEEITVSAIKIAELTNETCIDEKARRIIFPYKKINGKFIAYDEDTMQNQFPKAYAYLLSKKEILETRSSGKKPLKYFYEWGRIQSMEAPSDKLLTKTFSGRPNFILDKTNSLFCNGYAVKAKPEIDVLVLQKILNSKVMDYYSKLTSFQLNGNYQCFQKNFIELFNIPELSLKDIEYIKKNNGDSLDKYLCVIYDLNYEDILEIINR